MIKCIFLEIRLTLVLLNFSSRYFEIGILLTIITNCVFMALSMEEGSKTAEISEYV